MGKNTLPKKEENFFLYSTEATVGTGNGTWTGVYIALSSLAVSYSPPSLSHPYTQHFYSLALTALFYTLTQWMHQEQLGVHVLPKCTMTFRLEKAKKELQTY